MSGLNGSGEMSLGNLKAEIAETNIASLFAQDIVNEVLQKALDIATQVHESKIVWNSDGKNYTCQSLTNSDIKIRNINLEGTCKPDSIEMEAEKVSADVASLPCKDLPGRGGVGDQPISPRGNEIEVSDEPAPPEIPAAPVEKKSRVADLVKSSKQVLSAYIMDEKAKQIRDKLEEDQEQFLQVIELDCVEGSVNTFKAYKKYDPAFVPIPSDETDGELMQIPTSNDDMDTIELNKIDNGTMTKKPQENCGKEDEGGNAADEIQDVAVLPSEAGGKTCEFKEKKKKWNFGARLMQFLKRPKQKAHGTQTVTRN